MNMKGIAVGLMSMVLMAAPAFAGTLVVDVDPPDLGAEWVGSDINPSSKGQLINSNPSTEEAWLEALLGGTDVTFVLNSSFDDPTPTSLTDFDPNVSWDYAVVKYDNIWVAYSDAGDDDLLTVGPFDFGISHVDFFTSGPSVPEPSVLILLGSGLVGLGAFARSRRRSR